MNENANTAANERCAKCGGEAAGVQFHGANRFGLTACTLPISGDGWYTKAKGEHLHRWCVRCGWDWVGTPLDAAPAVVTGA